MKTSLHPKRWFGHTWLLVLVWLAWATWMNVWGEVTSEYVLSSTKGPSMMVEDESALGFPIRHGRYTEGFKYPSGRYFVVRMQVLVNVMMCTAAIVSLVYCTQQSRKISISTLLILTAAVAIYLAIPPLRNWFQVMVYLAPIAVAIAISSRHWIPDETPPGA